MIDGARPSIRPAATRSAGRHALNSRHAKTTAAAPNSMLGRFNVANPKIAPARTNEAGGENEKRGDRLRTFVAATVREPG